MPYRRLPKTDAARLRALKTLLENDDVYTARNRFIDWKTLNSAKPAYEKLLTADQQYKLTLNAQTRYTQKLDKPRNMATMYVSHFLQVLLLAVERGEIKRSFLPLYGLEESAKSLPNIKTDSNLLEWGLKIINGEKERLKKGGRPIYNPTIGMVSTHIDIFKEAYEQQNNHLESTHKALCNIQKLRPEVDEIILNLWNQIEAHFESFPDEEKYKEGRKYGIVYYYRRKEPHTL